MELRSIESMELLIYGGFLLGGVLTGWWWRSRRDLPERLRLVEHFERRARLAESEQEVAMRKLNENLVQMRRIEGLFEARDSRIEELERETQGANNETSAMRKDLQRAQQEAVGAKEGRAGLVARTGELEQAAEVTREELEDLRVRARELDERLVEECRRAEDAERREAGLVSDARALEARIAGKNDIEAELEAQRQLHGHLVEDLGQVRGELGGTLGRLERLPSLEAERDAALKEAAGLSEQLSEARARIGELDRSAEEQRASQRATDEEMSRSRERERQLEQERDAISEQLRGVRDEVEGLAGVPGELAELQRERGEMQRVARDEISRWEERYATVEAARDALAEQLSTAQAHVAELAPVTGELAEARRSMGAEVERWTQRTLEIGEAKEELTARLASAETLAAGLESLRAELKEAADGLAVSEKARARESILFEAEAKALRLSRSEAKGLASEFKKAQRTIEDLSGRLEAGQDKGRAVREKLDAAQQVEKSRRAEVEGFKKRLSELTSGQRAVQQKSERVTKRVEDLERELGKRKAQLAEATQAVREKDRSIRTLQTRLEKGVKAAGKSPASGVIRPVPRRTEKAASRTTTAKVAAKVKPSKQAARGASDELQELTGVGPALEAKLRRAGVRSYAGLARLDRSGLESLAQRIGVSDQLPRKNKWVSEAKRLHRQKYGESVGT